MSAEPISPPLATRQSDRMALRRKSKHLCADLMWLFRVIPQMKTA